MILKRTARATAYGGCAGAAVGLLLIIAGWTSPYPGYCIAQVVMMVACGAGVGLGVAYGPKQSFAKAQQLFVRARRWFVGDQPRAPLGRWQFAIAHVLAAMVGLAFVFGILAPIEVFNNIAIGFAAIVVVSSIVVPHLGRMAVGVPVVLASFWLGLGMGELLVGKSDRFGGPGLALVAWAVVIGCVVLLRLYGRYSAWHLLGSLLLLQAFLFLVAFPNRGSVFTGIVLGWDGTPVS